MMFPGFAGSINLGQNATLTLAILVWGWALAARGRPALGGMVWGLLAFKPVWALAFFLVPLLSRRWRMCLAMVATGTGLGLLTLPFVGLHSWFDWLAIGKEAADTYDVERNWIFLSRDLLSVPRRYLLDFEKGYWERLDGTFFLLGRLGDHRVGLACFLFGWAMILFALENTVRLAVLRRRQAAGAGRPAGGVPASSAPGCAATTSCTTTPCSARWGCSCCSRSRAATCRRCSWPLARCERAVAGPYGRRLSPGRPRPRACRRRCRCGSVRVPSGRSTAWRPRRCCYCC